MLDLKKDDYAVIFDKNNKPISVGRVDRVNSQIIEVNYTRFSKKTGKILSNQDETTSINYRVPNSNFEADEYISYRDVSGRIEPFDMSLLKDVEVKSQNIEYRGSTIAEFFQNIKNDMESLNIPLDASIDNFHSESFTVSFVRKETPFEYSKRVFFDPTVAEKDREFQLKDIDSQIASLQEEKKSLLAK